MSAMFSDPADVVTAIVSPDLTPDLARWLSPPPWHEHAACAGEPIATFFGMNATRAKKICAECAVLTECLEEALADESLDHGVRGGLTAPQRQRLRDERLIAAAHRETGDVQPPAGNGGSQPFTECAGEALREESAEVSACDTLAVSQPRRLRAEWAAGRDSAACDQGGVPPASSDERRPSGPAVVERYGSAEDGTSPEEASRERP